MPRYGLQPYKQPSFDELYSSVFKLMLTELYLPEELWRYIYKLAMPNFKHDDMCKIDQTLYYWVSENVKIVNAYYCRKGWLYSVDYCLGVAKFIQERHLEY